MCRWIAYIGEPIYMDTVITKPTSSLLEQSLNAKMAFKIDGSILSTNGDGFGVGWYSEKTEPGIFKDSEPAWLNQNLHEICTNIKARIFMAHIRSATTGSVQRSNSHPFKYKNWLFQHNGFVNNFDQIRRILNAKLTDEQYQLLSGTTDSEVIFRLMLSFGLQLHPKKAIEKTIKFLKSTLKKVGVKPEMTLSCALSDGAKIYTIRHSTMSRSNSQFYSVAQNCLQDIGDNDFLVPNNSIVIVSEPLDHHNKRWNEMPNNSFAIIENGEVKIEELKLR